MKGALFRFDAAGEEEIHSQNPHDNGQNSKFHNKFLTLVRMANKRNAAPISNHELPTPTCCEEFVIGCSVQFDSLLAGWVASGVPTGATSGVVAVGAAVFGVAV